MSRSCGRSSGSTTRRTASAFGFGAVSAAAKAIDEALGASGDLAAATVALRAVATCALRELDAETIERWLAA